MIGISHKLTFQIISHESILCKNMCGAFCSFTENVIIDLANGKDIPAYHTHNGKIALTVSNTNTCETVNRQNVGVGITGRQSDRDQP